jgi:hypothetical protein
MLVLSACGMAIGLTIDCGTTPPDLIAALCAASSGSLAATLAFHATVMPASYAATAAAAVLAATLTAATHANRRRATRFAKGAASVVLMLAGMFVGGWLAPDAAAMLGAEPGFATLVGGMVTGMAAAALAAAAIAYALDAAIAREDRRRSQYIMYQ